MEYADLCCLLLRPAHQRLSRDHRPQTSPKSRSLYNHLAGWIPSLIIDIFDRHMDLAVTKLVYFSKSICFMIKGPLKEFFRSGFVYKQSCK